MNSLLTIIDIVLAFWCAFQAGKMKAAIDIEGIESNKKLPASFYFWMYANAVMSLYLMISIFGRGITRGMS